jgi:gliding motility-associated-like protein
MVMPGSVSGIIQISTSSGLANSLTDFTVISPAYPQTQIGDKLVFPTGNVSLIQGIAIDISDDGQTAILGPYGNGLGEIAFFKKNGCGWTQDGQNIYLGWNTPVKSVALSSDGTTAVVGGDGMIGGNLGCVWVFIRNNGVWVQQGPRLLGTGYTTNQPKASAVDISADGNTLIYGDSNDNDNGNGQYVGATWVFSRTNGVWSQQGAKLIGSGYVLSTPSGCTQGKSVSISKDGNTIAIGGPLDAGKGATWVFSKVNNNWIQQGSKIIGTGGSVYARQGTSVSLSADGDRLIVGGPNDGGGIWFFSRINGNWIQQAGPIAMSNMEFGSSVSLSADGNSALIGAPGFNNSAGNSWIYRFNGGSWSVFGNALVGVGNIGNAHQGFSVSLTSDANFALVGGPWDNNLIGATWVFGSGVISNFNPLQDTTRVCGFSTVLDAGAGYSSYLWNNGALTQSITTSFGGYYKVTVTNNSGCIGSDSTYLSLVTANILNNDTTVCKGSSLTLYVDSSASQNSACYSSQLSANIRNGLVGYWPFCGNANDESGNNNHGTVFGATLTTDRFGRSNSAYNFSSQNANYIRCPGSSIFTSNSMTLSFWINITNYNELSEIICLGDATGTYWGASVANRIVSLNYGSGCGNGMMTYPTYNFTPSNWYNVTFVANRTTRLNKVYINGQYIGDNPSGVLSGCSTSYLYFGVDIFGLPEYFTGKLDDVFIWNRALSINEIQQVSSGSLISNSVLWSTGATSNSISVSPTQPTTYYASITDGITNCIDSVRVNIASVDTSIIALDLPQVCTTSGQVRLQAGVASSYQWQSSTNGVNFTNINGATSRVYSATTTGYYRVKVTNSLNCLDSSRAVQITLNPQPQVSFTVNNSAQCLPGNSFSFTNTSSISGGSMLYLWSFGNGNTAITTNATQTYLTAGSYIIKLVASSTNGCRDSATRTITVYSTPTGVLNTPSTTLLCEGGSIMLSASGGSVYQWFLNGALINGATSSSYTASQPGTYTVNITSANGCTGAASGSVVLQLISKPVANFTYANYCATFPTQFSDQSTIANSGVVGYNWSFGNGQGTSNLQNPNYTYQSSGTYNVTLTLTPVACPTLSASYSKSITLVLPPANQRYPTVNAVVNRNLQLEARSFGSASYSWSPANGLNLSTIFNPIFNYNTQTEYLISITTPIGCVIKDTQLVRIFREKEIYVPKGFSPNSDNSNDKIFPRLVGIRTLLYFRIYDRWGQLLFQTSNENEGWDGKYKGVKQPLDTYVWIAEGIDIDNMNLKRTGTFLLLR